MPEVFTKWTCIFPGKMGLSWKRAWDGVGTKAEAETEATKHCNVIVVPLALFEKMKEHEQRMVVAENKLTICDRLSEGEKTIEYPQPHPEIFSWICAAQSTMKDYGERMMALKKALNICMKTLCNCEHTEGPCEWCRENPSVVAPFNYERAVDKYQFGVDET